MRRNAIRLLVRAKASPDLFRPGQPLFIPAPQEDATVSAKPPKANHNPETPAAMDQVRDILFGAQLKEMDTRMQRQEERFARSIEDAKGALKNKIESLENFMKSEVASILARIKEEEDERTALQKTEQRERQEAVTQLAKDLASAQEALERKLAKHAATLDAAERELRQLMQKENGSLADKIQEKYEHGLQVLRNTAEEIRADMVYRSALASMFTETAVKLSGQWSSDENGSPGVDVSAEDQNG
jgi:hypothetical protein